MSRFKLKEPLGSNYRATPDDIVSTKQALNKLGYYNVPTERGIDDWTDNALFKGIRAFQQDSGLKVDGFMRPEGPTEKAINTRLGGLSGRPAEEPPGAATHRCVVCGAWHGGVFSPNVCWQCLSK